LFFEFQETNVRFVSSLVTHRANVTASTAATVLKIKACEFYCDYHGTPAA
jgi:hypothetical protein